MITAGVQLLGSRAKNFALGAQESPWGAPRATKTSPANFCNFFKSFTCVNKRCLVQSTGTLSLPVNTSNSWQLIEKFSPQLCLFDVDSYVS